MILQVARRGSITLKVIALLVTCLLTPLQPVVASQALSTSTATASTSDHERGSQTRIGAVVEDSRSRHGGSKARRISFGANKGATQARSWGTSTKRNVLGTQVIANERVEKSASSSGKGVFQILKEFNKGLRLLWSEIGLARQTAARKRAGDTLTFQEQRLLRQVPRDVFKAAPIVMGFLVPIIGALFPLMSIICQKALLPAQFWSWSQQGDYMMQDALGQEVSTFPALLRSLATTTSPPRPNSTPKQLRSDARWFANEGSLDHLSRAHLLSLVRACNVMPSLKKASSIIVPSPVLRLWLRQEAGYLSDDDAVLLQLRERRGSLRVKINTEGNGTLVRVAPTSTLSENLADPKYVLSLTAREIEVLCWERGILRSALDSLEAKNGKGAEREHRNAAVMLSRLEEWLSLYDTSDIAEASMESSPGRDSSLPASMLLHAPALLRFQRP